MRGDFTRDTRERARRTATRSVQLQQGRPLLDADVNEQAQLTADRSEAIVRHVVGLRGVPRDDAGFSITPSANGFTIGAGSLYAEGLPLANPVPVAYAAQLRAGVLPALTAEIPDGQEALVFVRAVLHPAAGALLADPALDGVETAVREAAAWTVRVAPLASVGMARADLIQALDRNQAVDLVPWRGTTGGLDADVDMANPDPGPCEISATAGYLDQLNRLYRVEIHAAGAPGAATFKWTEDASREAGLTPSGAGFAIDLPIARAADWFPTGAIVEVIDEDAVRAGNSGPMGAITSAPGAQLAISGVPAAALGDAVRIRRWAAMPVAVPAAGAWSALSKGVRVRFSSGNYAVGSTWTIPARTVLGDIVWPPYPAPDRTENVSGQPVDFYGPTEGRRYHAALALVRRNGTAFAVTQDLRDLFPPLTDITARAVRFDDGTAHLGATNVQQAIDALAGREAECCTWHAGPSTDLQALVDRIPPRGNGTLCLSAGNYTLTAPLRIVGKGHIRLVGSGPGSKLWCRNGAQALVIEDCLSAEVRDMLVAAEAPGAMARIGHTAGAVDVSDTGPVRVLRATLMASGTHWRQSACLRVVGSTKHGGGDITVEDCDVVAGDLATGILVTEPHTLRIAGNRIRTRAEPLARTVSRWAQDPTMAAAVGRLAMSHAVDAAARTRPVTRQNPRVFTDRTVLIGNINLNVFTSNAVTPSVLSSLAEQLIQESPLGDSRRFRLRMRRIASTILIHAGRPVVRGVPFTGFQSFYNIVRPLAAPSIDTGIVVGGTFARDVVITGNRIEHSLRGIRVAVNAGVPQQRLPLGTLRVEGNFIRLRVVPTDIARTGIYVGNAERAWIVDNDIANETEDDDLAGGRAPALRDQHFDALHAEGVRVFGALGPMIQIRGNMVRGCVFPFTLTRAKGTDSRPKLWLLQGNYAAGGVTAYRVDGACRTVDNI